MDANTDLTEGRKGNEEKTSFSVVVVLVLDFCFR